MRIVQLRARTKVKHQQLVPNAAEPHEGSKDAIP